MAGQILWASNKICSRVDKTCSAADEVLTLAEQTYSSRKRICSMLERSLWTADKICSAIDKICSIANRILLLPEEILPALEAVLLEVKSVSAEIDKGSVPSEEQRSGFFRSCVFPFMPSYTARRIPFQRDRILRFFSQLRWGCFPRSCPISGKCPICETNLSNNAHCCQ